MTQRRSWLIYPAWIAFCPVLFFALRILPDPSRRKDRVGQSEGANHGVLHLRRADAARCSGHEALHAAYSAAGALSSEGRWVVLYDRPDGVRLQDAVVV